MEVQTDLFGLDGSVPASRRTDPDPSKQAEQRLRDTGKLKGQREQCLEAVKRLPGMTSLELSKATGVDRYILARRLPELRSLGLVYCPDELKRCTVGGGNATCWWPNK